MPTYLIAFVVGDLDEAKVGNRTWVITEPINLEKSVNELK